MKRLCVVLFGLVLMLIAVGCCSHEWKEATCTTPKTCEKCGATEGKPFGHKWTEATCTEPKQCTICGTTEGTALGHKWTEATCTEAKKCSVCGETEGDPLGHKWIEATCTEAKRCSVCGEESGEAKGHKWENATASKPKTCRACGLTEGNPLGYSYFSMDTHEFVSAYNKSEHALGTLKTDYNHMKIDGTSFEIIFLASDVSTDSATYGMYGITRRDFNRMIVRLVDHKSNESDEDYLTISFLTGYTFAEVLDPTLDLDTLVEDGDLQSNGKNFTLSYSHNGYDYVIKGYDATLGKTYTYYYDFEITLSANREA